MPPKDIAAAVMVAMIWGGNFGVAKLGLQDTPAIFLMATRFLAVAILVVPFVRVPYHRMGSIFGLAVTLGFVHFAMMFSGLKLLDASTAAIAQQVQVPFSALLGAILYRERLSLRRIAGMALAFVGVMLLAGDPKVLAQPLGLGLVVAASVMWCFAALQMKNLVDVSPIASNGWMALFAAPMLYVASAALESGQVEAVRHADWTVGLAILYMAVPVTLIGYSLWYRLLRAHPVSRVMPFTLLVPVFGVISGMLVMGDRLTWPIVAGAALTICGVASIVLERPRLAKP
jgi:O-acetylserine/cysteine efflux transporter